MLLPGVDFLFQKSFFPLCIFCCSREDLQSLSKMNYQRKQNIFVPLSEGVTTCASHPLNGTIVAGTKVSVLF